MEKQSVEITIKIPVPLNSKAYILTRNHFWADFKPVEVTVNGYLLEADGKVQVRCARGFNDIRYRSVDDVYATEEEAQRFAPELLKRYGGGEGAGNG